MMARWGMVTAQPALEGVSNGEELLDLRSEVDRVHVAEELKAYILNLVRATRGEKDGAAHRNKYLAYGASPRASLGLFQAGRALAWLRGSDHVTPGIIQDIFLDTMRHRIGLTYEAEAEEVSPDAILQTIVEETPVPGIRTSTRA